MKRIIDHDPGTGITNYFEYDSLTDTTILSTVQDVEPYLERAKSLYNDDEYSKHGIKEGTWHYAHIPNIIIEKWLKEGINVYNKDHRKKVFEKLNDPEYRYLKTTHKFHRPKN